MMVQVAMCTGQLQIFVRNLQTKGVVAVEVPGDATVGYLNSAVSRVIAVDPKYFALRFNQAALEPGNPTLLADMEICQEAVVEWHLVGEPYFTTQAGLDFQDKALEKLVQYPGQAVMAWYGFDNVRSSWRAVPTAWTP